MTVLPAQHVRALCSHPDRRAPHCIYEQFPCAPTRDAEWWDRGAQLVVPYAPRTRHAGKTYGLGPAGFDVRVAESFWLWPFWGRLASTQERFDLPRDVTFLVQDKSSWARQFVFAMNTNAEPGWQGYLTLELVRLLPWPIRIRAGDPIANIMFLRLEAPTDQPYEGKYQDQEAGPQSARWDTLTIDREPWPGRLAGLLRRRLREGLRWLAR